MSTRPELRPYQVITDGSMADDITSIVTVVQKISIVSYTISWSGTSPVGTLAIQVSNDYKLRPDGTVADTGNWSSIPFNGSVAATPALTLAVSGNTGTANLASLHSCSAYAVRLFYDRSSGTGTLQAYVCGKVA